MTRCHFSFLYRDPGGIQTHDLQNRNLMLYSAKLQGRDAILPIATAKIAINHKETTAQSPKKEKALKKAVKSMFLSIFISILKTKDLSLPILGKQTHDKDYKYSIQTRETEAICQNNI